MKSQRATKRRCQDEFTDIASAAELLEKECKEVWTKFRACCNHIRTDLKDEQGDFIPFDGIEDRWVNETRYRVAQFDSQFCTIKEIAARKDIQAAMYFQDMIMDPHYPDASISLVLTLARDWIRRTAQRIQEEESARIAAKVVARNSGSIRPELSRNDFNMLFKELKSEVPRVRDDEWLSDLKKDFERVQIHKTITKEAE